MTQVGSDILLSRHTSSSPLLLVLLLATSSSQATWTSTLSFRAEETARAWLATEEVRCDYAVDMYYRLVVGRMVDIIPCVY